MAVERSVAPSATPADALSTLERMLMQVLKDSSTNNRLTLLGFDVDGPGPETFRRLIREESELWKNVIKAAGLKRRG
jgi:tripartite-type tricarboxylate transporter receptor subunit TctC